MKRLLLIFILTINIQSWTKADEIKDFEIECISIGDSILDYFSKKEIKKARKVTRYKDNTYTTLQFDKFKSENYDYMSLSYKTTDATYIVVGISGGKYFKNNINDCYANQDMIYKDFKELFPNSQFYKIRKKKLSNLIDSTTRQSYMQLNDGSFAGIQCYDYGKQDQSKKNYTDVLRVSLFNKDYNYWLVNIAFK